MDKSGTIDYSEFINLTLQSQKILNRENLTKAFNMLDVDGNGQVSSEELKKAFN